MSRYAVYGLTIESAFALGTLPPAATADRADIHILQAPAGAFAGLPADASDTSWYRHQTLADGSIYVAIPGVLQAIVSADGRTARCASLAADVRAFEANLLNFVLIAALTLQGEEPFHATVVRLDGRAVGFLGDSGLGKSTLAASFLAKDGELVTDDILRIGYDADVVLAYRGPPRLKLFDDEARRLLPTAARDAAFNPMSGKLLIEAAAAHEDRVPLAALFWLGEAEPEDEVEVEVRRVGGGEAIRVLLASTLHLDHRPRQRIALQLRAIERLARTVPLFGLGYARRHDLLPKVADAVRDACRHVRS
jgi:hypothetical protein